MNLSFNTRYRVLLHFALNLLHIALTSLLHCVKSYYILRYYYNLCKLLHFVAYNHGRWETLVPSIRSLTEIK